MRYLTFALTKGRLANKTLELLEKVGITCEQIHDKSSRKLIFVNEELKLKFFLAKGPDVPTYVEYGAADIGVVGKDTILEEGRKVHEVCDLQFGNCRMCVCGPESAKELLKRRELIRVATKYPNIAKDYFYDKRHQTVEIIKLNAEVFVVEGNLIDNLLRKVNFDDPTSLDYFQRMLREKGVIDALRNKGAKDGCVIRIEDMEFDFVD